MENALVRVPSLAEMEVIKLINGPEAFTPDGEFILGPTEVRGLWTAAGFCAHGLAGAGGLGQLVAERIVEGTPSLDTWHMDSRRFGRAYRSLLVQSQTLAYVDTFMVLAVAASIMFLLSFIIRKNDPKTGGHVIAE